MSLSANLSFLRNIFQPLRSEVEHVKVELSRQEQYTSAGGPFLLDDLFSYLWKCFCAQFFFKFKSSLIHIIFHTQGSTRSPVDTQ